MEQTNEIPNLEALDPTNPKYATQLEQGWNAIREMQRDFQTELLEMRAGLESGLMERLKEAGLAEGDVERKDIGIGMTVEGSYTVTLEGKAQQRRAEDIITQYQREMLDQLHAIKDKKTILERAEEDFKEKILDLTQVTPLNTPNPENSSMLFYIVRPGDGVYEVRAEMTCKMTDVDKKRDIARTIVGGGSLLGYVLSDMIPDELLEGMSAIVATDIEKNPDLKPEAFLDQGCLSDFKAAQADVTDKSVYLVINPTPVVSENVLAKQGLKEAQKTLCIDCPKYKDHVKDKE
jgi:hypothetical protein